MKREFLNINTSENTKMIDARSSDGLLIIAVAVNIIMLIILFSL